MRVREMEPADLPAVTQLCGELGYPTTLGEVKTRYQALHDLPDHHLLVAEADGGDVVGWVHVGIGWTLEGGLRSEIDGLVVSEAHRGSGIGASLMAAAEQWAQAQGSPAMRIRSNVVRERAHRFYERLGYVIVKRQAAFEKKLAAD